jgi:hypothetical protein
MGKIKPIFLGILIMLFAITVYCMIFKKSAFGATTTQIVDFIKDLREGKISPLTGTSSSEASAGVRWKSTFSPSASNLTRYSLATTTAISPATTTWTVPGGIPGTSGPFLLYDPGWVQPSSTPGVVRTPAADTYTSAGGGTTLDFDNILGATNTGTNAGSISTTSVFTPVIGWAASGRTNATVLSKQYYYSPTCLSAIPNSYFSGTSITAIPLTITDNYYTSICGGSGDPSSSRVGSSGPSGTCGEYGAFNAYFQFDYYASAFMNNDTLFWPFTITTGRATGIPDISNLSGVKTFYTPGISTVLGSFNNPGSTISYSQAMGIPANAIFNNTIDMEGGYGKSDGDAMSTMASINKTDITLTFSQKIRRNVIMGVLVAMHALMGGTGTTSTSGDVIANNGPFNGYNTGILMDLKYYYNQYQYSGVAPTGTNKEAIEQTHGTESPINTNSVWGIASVAKTQTVYTTGSSPNSNSTSLPKNNSVTGYPSPGIFISNNTLHAIYLTLMARDNWIKNQLNNINLL